MKDTVPARKYAQALFAEATAKGQILACQQGLHEIIRVMRAKESLRDVLVQPFIGFAEKKRLVEAVLGEYSTPLLERFLNLLVDKDRFDLLPVITQMFEEFVDLSQNIEVARVRTAYPMTDVQRKTLQTKLEAFLEKKVRMDISVDSELIGGIVVQLRDRILDQSLGTQLKQLKEALS